MRSNPSSSGQQQQLPPQQQPQQPQPQQHQIPIQSYQEQRPAFYEQRMFKLNFLRSLKIYVDLGNWQQTPTGPPPPQTQYMPPPPQPQQQMIPPQMYHPQQQIPPQSYYIPPQYQPTTQFVPINYPQGSMNQQVLFE
jgi:hypothetical protein